MKLVGFPILRSLTFKCKILGQFECLKIIKDLYAGWQSLPPSSHQKRRWSCDFPARKTLVAQKHPAVSCQEKMAFPTPTPLGCLGTPVPPPQSLYGWVGGRAYADVTTKISRIDRLLNLLSNGFPLVC